ncbi:MAG: ROK family protein [Deltaproteobacteria bacterium]|nr:ROK family protein [Deltaproteobacteria bacterium]MBW2070354.1 ROK family protein [Deltaproteobacteria bacterium]
MSRVRQLVIGVDLGGTNIKIGLVDPQEELLLERARLKTLAERGPEAIVDELADKLHLLRQTAHERGWQVTAVGMGSAGVIDSRRGVVLTSPNLPGWHEYPLGPRLRELLGLPVVVENDVNCIGCGEYWLGAGRQLSRFVCIALGTGVGGCLMIDGNIWQGEECSAGEIGHLTILPEGDRCLCGNRGCLETLASASWLVRRAEDRLRRGESSTLAQELHKPAGLSAEAIYQAAMKNDALARDLLGLAGKSLAIAIANVVHLLGIRNTLIVGGMASAWESFIGPLRAELQERLTLVPVDEVRVIRGQLGDDAGILGAAYLACRL